MSSSPLDMDVLIKIISLILQAELEIGLNTLFNTDVFESLLKCRLIISSSICNTNMRITNSTLNG